MKRLYDTLAAANFLPGRNQTTIGDNTDNTRLSDFKINLPTKEHS